MIKILMSIICLCAFQTANAQALRNNPNFYQIKGINFETTCKGKRTVIMVEYNVQLEKPEMAENFRQVIPGIIGDYIYYAGENPCDTQFVTKEDIERNKKIFLSIVQKNTDKIKTEPKIIAKDVLINKIFYM